MATERLWNSNYCKVMTANFTLFFAFYLLTPLLPLYLNEHFQATKDTIGLVLSGYSLTALIARPFSGFLVDSFPRKRVLLWCFFFFFLFFGGYLAASSLLMFTIVRTLHGAPFGAVTVANSTAAVDVLPSSRRNEGIGYYGLSNNLSMAIAPSIGIFLYRMTHNFEMLFWVALAIALIGLMINTTLDLPSRPVRDEKKKLSLDRFFLLSGWMLAVNMACFGFCFGVLSNYLAIYSRDVLGISGGTGTYFILLSVGLIASRLQGSKGLREGRLTRNAAEGVLLSSAGYLLFILCPNEWGYYLSALLIGLGNGHIWPAFLNMIISMARHNQRGTANSTLLVSWDVGMGMGVLIGGLTAEHLGYKPTFWLVAMVQIVGCTIYFLSTRQHFERKRLR